MSGKPHTIAPRGLGVRPIHTRPCLRNGVRDGRPCICEPPWQAFYYDARAGKKVRKQFRTKAEAVKWRRMHVQRIYKLDVAAAGRIDAGYQHLRKAMLEFNAAITSVNIPARASLRDAFAHLHKAEDAVIRAGRDAIRGDRAS